MASPLSEFIPGRFYWIIFIDGSRIRVEATVDSHGDIDVRNDLVDFSLWVGCSGQPYNREHIHSIEDAR